MMHLRQTALLTCLLFGLLCAACDRNIPDDAPATAVPSQEAGESEPGAALSPAHDEQFTPQQAAVERCTAHNDPGAQSDCLAEAALAADGLSVADRSAFCDEAPRQIRCEYLFATNHDGARLCDRSRFHEASTFFRECDFLQVVTGIKERCEHSVHRGYAAEDDELAPCELPIPAQIPTTGDAVDELLTAYFLALSEASLRRARGSDCPDLMRNEALNNIQEAIEIDERAREVIQTGLFPETLKTRVAYHEMTGAFDPATWEGLREVLLLSPMHGPGVVAHVTPTDRLEFREDGTFHMRRNLRYSPEDPNQFVESEGSWRIVSAVPGEEHAIIEIDGKEYAFGKTSGPSMQYFLHPRDEVHEGHITFEFFDEDYFGEAC